MKKRFNNKNYINNYFLLIIILFLIGIFLYINQYTSYTVLSYGSTIPQGFGVPWNLFSNEHENILDSSNNNIIARGTYIYRYGYIYANNQWQRFEFPQPKVYDNWIRDNANFDIRSLNLNPGEYWFIAYTCSYMNNEWKCGCRTNNCRYDSNLRRWIDGGMWQLQRISVGGSMDGRSISISSPPENLRVENPIVRARPLGFRPSNFIVQLRDMAGNVVASEPLFDNGQNGDLAANDGEYGTTINTNDLQSGRYVLYLQSHLVDSPTLMTAARQIEVIARCGEAIRCNNLQDCINGRCSLRYTPYRLGLVYVYNNPDTYNPNWRTDIGVIIPKVENALRELTDNRIDASIQVLGEVQTNIFNWNPARLGLSVRSTDGTLFYETLPGSEFEATGRDIGNSRILELDCERCIIDGNIVRVNFDRGLSYENLVQSDRLQQLQQQISEELQFNFDNYDGVFIVFGRLGRPLDTDDRFLRWACSGLRSIIGGYSNLIMSENYIIEPNNYFIDCRGTLWQLNSHYQKVGWHMMIHEILHRFGAEDIYQTGTTFGVRSERERALEIDPRADESIMGDDTRDCIDEGGLERDGNICTREELARVYLDRYNRQLIGLE